MSNSLAIAAVTETLRSLISRGGGIKGVTVTASPLDNARRSETGNQINLFLYQVLPNAAWRNQDMPRQLKPGETGRPPLALTLYYLITAYSGNENDTDSHALLGGAMRALYDHPLLGPDEISAVTSPIDSDLKSDLENQVERVRITLQPLTFEEMSKLWTTFQTHYRVSAAYQVSVVLIESAFQPKTPLPVLRRGEEDRGVTSQPDPTSPFPALTSIQLPERRLSGQPGDVIALHGSRLTGAAARLSSLRFDAPPQPATAVVSDTRLDVTLPAGLAAGFYTVSARLATPRGEISSNELPLAVAPVITTQLPMAVASAAGEATINLTTSVNALPKQRVSLLLGDYETQAEARAAATNSFKFIVRARPGGEFPVPKGVGLIARLRVDGVDSEVLAPRLPGEPEGAPPKFDDAKKITIN